ncbi:MAG: hypothetical protein ACRDRV_15855 [Pseudonocardiaceae bacterium]
MDTVVSSAAQTRYRLEWDGAMLELVARRAGLRTEAVLLRDGRPVSEGSGAGRVLLPVAPESDGDQDGAARGSPSVLVLSVLPGTISRAVLLVPKPGAGDGSDGPAELPKGVAELAGFARAERHPFEPPPGTFTARLLAFQRKHPRLYAARHVVLAVGKVVLGLLGVALLAQLILRRVVGWIAERLPHLDLTSIPWPDVDLPSMPWPDLDLPGLSPPGWLLAVLATAKYWVPILVAVGLAVREVRKRRAKSDPGRDGTQDAHR